ncbi:hypothetical protein HI113_32745 [Corallococcus exiguus]|uniref:hypothetical protein n=1 Tax=Corallococcus exiguus TaxID=83462 RepID=UPI001475433D|nr:hypothetical protein [Corallococcus exiguus]NNB98674.1 hypothetical protein [Corallococcus exiguus]
MLFREGQRPTKAQYSKIDKFILELSLALERVAAAMLKGQQRLTDVLAHARRVRKRGDLQAALYLDHGVEADVAYLLQLVKLERDRERQLYEGGSRPRLWASRGPRGARDDIALAERRSDAPSVWRSMVDVELVNAIEMLEYKLKRIEDVDGFWTGLARECARWAEPRETPQAELRELARQHQARMGALERQKRDILQEWSQANREKVEAKALSVERQKEAARREFEKRRAALEARIAHADSAPSAPGRRFAEQWLMGKVGKPVDMARYVDEGREQARKERDALAREWTQAQRQHQTRMGALERRKRDILQEWSQASREKVEAKALGVEKQKEAARRELAALRTRFEERIAEAETRVAYPPLPDLPLAAMRAKLELAGFLLLPLPLPMGGVFPSRDYCVLEGQLSKQARFAALVQHANALVRKYRFLAASEGRLVQRDLGCFCIMFAEEPTKDGRHTIHVPFFGISGGGSHGFRADDYLRKLGVPELTADEQGRNAMGAAGLRLVGRFFALRGFYEARRALGFKLPAKQAMLSSMQFMKGVWVRDALESSIASIQQWNSIQCAEPAAIMAAAQLFYRMADMELSVPFEGSKQLVPSDESGHWGKETCGRCAISEVSFAGVTAPGTRKEVRMCSVVIEPPAHGMDAREARSKEALPRANFDAMLGPELVYNSNVKQRAYDDPKRAAMFHAMEWFHQLGIAQSSHNPFWNGALKVPGAASQRLADPILERVSRYGLEGFFFEPASGTPRAGGSAGSAASTPGFNGGPWRGAVATSTSGASAGSAGAAAIHGSAGAGSAGSKDDPAVWEDFVRTRTLEEVGHLYGFADGAVHANVLLGEALPPGIRAVAQERGFLPSYEEEDPAKGGSAGSEK